MIEKVTGNLLDQDVEVIVNAWNRNIFPHWILIPQGVSKAIRERSGSEPFRELRKYGILPLGSAVVTSAGRLPYKAIVHVAGIGFNWRSSEESVRKSVVSAIEKIRESGFESVAFPLIGAGTGGGSAEEIEGLICEEVERSGFKGKVVVVRYQKAAQNK